MPNLRKQRFKTRIIMNNQTFNMQKTFEEIVAENFRNDTWVMQQKVIAAMQQAKSCTVEEILDVLECVPMPRGVLTQIMKIKKAADRIKTE